MKSTAELREDYLAKTQEAVANVTVTQLEKLAVRIAEAHAVAISESIKVMSIITMMDLSAQAQQELSQLGYEVVPLEYDRSEKYPLLYEIRWSY